MDSQDAKNILGQLFAGGAALAGLVLVFLGSVSTAYDAYDPEQQRSVRSVYRRRAWLAFWGLVAALLAATAGLVGLWRGPGPWLLLGTILLGASGVLVVFMAAMSVKDIS